MSDPYARLLEELSKRLPEKGDVELLKALLDDLRQGGRDTASARIKSLIKGLAGEG